MKNNVTELVFILDKSGSMSGFESDTVGGFNSMIAKQRDGEGEVLVSTVLFNDKSEVLHDRVPISAIREMTREDYCACGCTALLDAIGNAIHHIANVHKYARPEDVPEHTVFVITTDGMENSSRRYLASEVKAMIKERTDEYGWEFIFVAANIDAIETAGSIGIRPERAANYRQTDEGINACYSAMSSFISCCRTSKRVDADNTDWKKGLEDGEDDI